MLLIVHEIDSAYRHEWKLFKIPGGITVFLMLHFPVLILILYGLILVYEGSFAGLMFSFALSLAGVFAFSIHTFFILRGRPEFKAPVSLFVLAAALVTSIFQASLTIRLQKRGVNYAR